MSKDLIVKSNHLIEASYYLTLNEQRVILLAITQVYRKENIQMTDLFKISAQDFAKQFDLSLDGVYQELVKVTDKLYERSIIINQPDPNNPKLQKTKTRWISSISYMPDDGILLLSFAQAVIPYLTLLQREFTQYKLAAISQMTSIYAIRLYELLKQWGNIAKREVSIEWLKKQFEIDDKYDTLFNFKARVLTPAITQINKHSDLQVSYTQRKTGRVVTHFTFDFSPKLAIETKPKTPKKRPQSETINGVLKADIERLARAGESYEQAAERIKKQGLV
ncbi:MAG: replication initiation protein [Moraxellaceae bacterium]|nr:replication initiation protein [Moraxellaceae bacterium]MCP5177365.1 replication initiation protein [Moraxellaceae bacterium]